MFDSILLDAKSRNFHGFLFKVTDGNATHSHTKQRSRRDSTV